MKPILSVAGVVVVVLLLWMVPSAWALSGHTAVMKSALQASVDHYKTVGKTHVGALANLTGGLEPDASSVQKLIAAFGAVSRAVSTDDQLRAVHDLQKELGIFFAPEARHVNSLSTNEHFIALNQEITGNGEASGLIFEYNKAASVVRDSMQGFPGFLVGGMIVGKEPPFLFLDGVPRDVKVML